MEDRRLTVVQLLPALESGGVERGTLEVAAELVRRGHRSIVISAGGRMVERLEAEGSEHIAWSIGGKSPWTFRYVAQLREPDQRRAGRHSACAVAGAGVGRLDGVEVAVESA